MSAQDPELSAALGWPGGISDPAPDRTRLLQMVAALRLASQQALEVLKFCAPKPRPTDDDYAEQGWKEHNAAITALRAALAQQAEPMEPVAWVASKDGRVIYDDISKDDGLLRVSGDFEDDEQRVRYAKRIVDKLNAAPPQQAEPDLSRCPQCNGPADNGFDRSFPPSPYLCTKCMAEPVEPVAWRVQRSDGQYELYFVKASAERAAECYIKRPQVEPLYTAPPQRTMAPLTEEEINIIGITHQSLRQVARAVERAVWEKNHG